MVSDLLEFKRVELSKFAIKLLKEKEITEDDIDESFRLTNESIKKLIRKFVEYFFEDEKDQKENNQIIQDLIGFF